MRRPPPTLPVVLAGFAAFLDLYATQPLLPLLAQTSHASSFAVSLTITAPTTAVALAAPAVGWLADTIGLRRVIVTSAFALAAATLLAATSSSLQQLIFWRFVQGAVTPGVFAGTVAYVHEVWPATHSGRGTSAYMSGTVLGGFTGRAVAGLVASASTWPMAFVVLGGLTLLVACAVASWLPAEHVARRVTRGAESRETRARPTERAVVRVGALLRDRQLLATYAIGFCVLFTQVAMFTYVTFYLAAPPFSLTTHALGWLFSVYLVGAIATPLGGVWIDRYGHRAGLGSAMAIGAAGALLTLVPWLPAIVAGLALGCTGVFIAQATTSSYVGAVTSRDRGLAIGLYSTFYYAGGSVGGSAPSLVWVHGGWAACVALVVAIQMAGAAFALTQWPPTRSRHEEVPV